MPGALTPGIVTPGRVTGGIVTPGMVIPPRQPPGAGLCSTHCAGMRWAGMSTPGIVAAGIFWPPIVASGILTGSLCTAGISTALISCPPFGQLAGSGPVGEGVAVGGAGPPLAPPWPPAFLFGRSSPPHAARDSPAARQTASARDARCMVSLSRR
ncbi:hypothetical protein [Actinomadura madurae]|nr:hypothetical protein [Actinomadura madurae]MCQ0009064.1 hypothetical protein [Actinomadura madurae]